MLDIFEKWYRRYLFEEESVLLLVLIALGIVLLMTLGDVLTPVVASIVLAYLMQGVAGRIQRFGLPQWVGVAVSFLLFVVVWLVGMNSVAVMTETLLVTHLVMPLARQRSPLSPRKGSCLPLAEPSGYWRCWRALR